MDNDVMLIFPDLNFVMGCALLWLSGSAWGMGKSNHVVLLHYHDVYYSAQGGKNSSRLNLPPNSNAHSSELVYTRLPGSRTEPDGNLYTVMKMPTEMAEKYKYAMRPEDFPAATRVSEEDQGKDKDEHFGDEDDFDHDTSDSQGLFVLRSASFGSNWTWTQFPAQLSSVGTIAVNPVDASTIYAISPAGISPSTDKGHTWGTFLKAEGLTAGVSALVIKDSTTMIALRQGDVPLRTVDGGKSWAALTHWLVKKFSTSGYSRSASFSWSGKTLVIYGRDEGAPNRGEYAGYVLKSQDDGTTFTDETGDIVTSSIGSGTWYVQHAPQCVKVHRTFVTCPLNIMIVVIQ